MKTDNRHKIGKLEKSVDKLNYKLSKIMKKNRLADKKNEQDLIHLQDQALLFLKSE